MGNAMNSFRIEKGVPLFGKDITKDHNALEAGLDRFVKLDKGEFIGRAALQAVRDEGGPTRKSVMLEVKVGADPVDVVGNESIRCPETGKVVGFTTSGTWGMLTDKSLALGFVYGPERCADGYRLQVDLLGKKYDAYVRHAPAMLPASVRDKRAAKAVAAAVQSPASIPQQQASQKTIFT